MNDDIDRAHMLGRITKAVFELNLLLKAAAMTGIMVPIDVVEQAEKATGNPYSTIVVNLPVEG